jgi:small subunit ribosomal protein S5
MTETEIKQNTTVEAKPVTATAPATTAPAATSTFTPTPKGDFKKNRRNTFKGRKPKPRSDFESKIIDIRRVARVSSGGRRFSFSVVVVAGDRKGKVGVGIGKAGDTALAVEKATKDAKKKSIKLIFTKGNSIPHDIQAKFNSAVVKLMPAPGRGLIAGSATRTIIELAGLDNINAKILSGSKNKLNISKATIKALTSLKKIKESKNFKKEVVSDVK